MIPLVRPQVIDVETGFETFQNAVKSGVLTNFGYINDLLEKRLAPWMCGAVLTTSTGTAAIEIALRASLIGSVSGRGNRVAVPDFTHSGTLLAVVRAGFTPVLCRVNPATWQLEPKDIEHHVDRGEIAGAVVVSPFGYEVDFERWEALSKKWCLPLVYDLAGAYGMAADTENHRCYSFHATKNMGVGEGGCVVFKRAGQRDNFRRLTNFDTGSDRSIGSLDGYNYKMDELKASMLLVQVKHHHKVMERVHRKRVTLEAYQKLLKHEVRVPPGEHYPSLCAVGGLPAQEIERASERLGFVARAYYPLLSRMPALRNVERLSESEDSMANVCALPSDVAVEELIHVVDAINRHF